MASAIGAAQVTVLHNYPRMGVVIVGSTTLSIVEAHRTGTAQPRIGLGGPHAVIRLPTGSQALGNRFPARAAILPATGEVGPDRVTDLLAVDLAIMQAVAVWATGQVQAGLIALEAVISREAVVETGMPLGEVPEDTTDRARVATAVVVPPACRPAAVVEGEASVAVAEVVAEVEDAGKLRVAPGNIHGALYGYTNDPSESNSL